MKRAVAVAADTYLRKPTAADAAEFVTRVTDSRSHLEPYVYGPLDESQYRAWTARGERADTEQFLVCRRDDDAVAGFVNLNAIIRGELLSAAAGWASFVPHTGSGHLRVGVALALEVAFTQLGLHRVEANIQPANERSRRLAVRCGFAFEGYSPRYLRVGDQWRDHERWAVIADDWRAIRRHSASPPEHPRWRPG